MACLTSWAAGGIKWSAPAYTIYPYLFRWLHIACSNQVCGAGITYILMQRGFAYLVAVMDWYSRYVLAWEVSVSLDSSFCVEAMERALSRGTPEIMNTDQGAQFTSDACIGLLQRHGVRISMDGRGRVSGNIMTGRLWWSATYEHVYLYDHATVPAVKAGLHEYYAQYNTQRPHQALGYRRPAGVHCGRYYGIISYQPTQEWPCPPHGTTGTAAHKSMVVTAAASTLTV